VALSLYDWIYGVAQFAAAFLSLIAIMIALWMLLDAFRYKQLAPWRYLLPALIFFATLEIVGALVTFGIIGPSFLTHFLASLIMILLIAALVSQLYIVPPEEKRKVRA